MGIDDIIRGFFGTSKVDKLLKGVPFSRNVPFVYAERTSSSTGVWPEYERLFGDTTVFEPAYLLPIHFQNERVFATFVVDGRIVSHPIAFSFGGAYLDYTGHNLGGEKPAPDTIVLPLQKTSIKVSVEEAHPFVYGVTGAFGCHPLIPFALDFVGLQEFDNRVLVYSFVEESRGKDRSAPISLAAYVHDFYRPSDEIIETFNKEIHESALLFSHRAEEMFEEQMQLNIRTDGSVHRAKPPFYCSEDLDWHDPKSIVAYLDQYVVGQEGAKKTVAVAFSNYMLRCETKDESLPKENVLLIGPSGVGKTYMVSLLAKKAKLPMVQRALTQVVAEGYVGESISSGIFGELCSLTQEEAPYAIVFLDELDKTARDRWGSGSGFGSRIQNQLIGFLEAGVSSIEADRKEGTRRQLDTRNILFVTAGAFRGSDGEPSLDDIVEQRIGREGAVKKPRKEKYVLQDVQPEDLIKYGLKAELVGRLPAVGVLTPLSEYARLKILTDVKDSPLGRYKQLLQLRGYRLQVKDGVPEVIANYCPTETGARALNSVCSDLFRDIMYDPKQYADKEKVITLTPVLVRRLVNLYR